MNAKHSSVFTRSAYLCYASSLVFVSAVFYAIFVFDENQTMSSVAIGVNESAEKHCNASVDDVESVANHTICMLN